MNIDTNDIAEVLRALRFAAHKHRDQRRKGEDASPYINHPIAVAEVIARVGGVRDLATIQAAILHDTIEDTETTPEELEKEFGPRVRAIVEEVTDDKSLTKEERKRLQIEHAPHVSVEARLVKLGDKISNVIDVGDTPPPNWSTERRNEYFDWTERVIAGVRGTNPQLEEYYDEMLRLGREKEAKRRSDESSR